MSGRRLSRFAIYTATAIVAALLLSIYICASLWSPDEWPKDGRSWSNELVRSHSPEDLHAPLTVVEVAYVNGRLHAVCAYKNLDEKHGIEIHGYTDDYGSFWMPAVIGASVSRSGPWVKLGRATDMPLPQSRILHPGDVEVVHVDIDDCRRFVGRYGYAQILMATGVAAQFSFEALRAPPMNVPTREWIQYEREHGIELIPNEQQTGD